MKVLAARLHPPADHLSQGPLHTGKGIGSRDVHRSHAVRLEHLERGRARGEHGFQVATGNGIAVHAGKEGGVEEFFERVERRRNEGGGLGS